MPTKIEGHASRLDQVEMKKMNSEGIKSRGRDIFDLHDAQPTSTARPLPVVDVAVRFRARDLLLKPSFFSARRLCVR